MEVLTQSLLTSNDIEFDPKGPIRYKINGIPVPGVTSISGLLPKEWLAPWAAKMAVTYLKEKWIPGKPYSKGEISALLDEAKKAHKVTKDEAANRGTSAHDWFELYVKAQMNGSRVLPGFPEDPFVMNSIRLFLQYIEATPIEWLHSEVVVGSRTHMFAGKFDAIAKIKGVTYLIDFKTASGIYYEQYVQTAAYALACEEMGLSVQQRLILWVPKTGNAFMGRVVPTPMELDQKCFLHAKGIYHALASANNIIKCLDE